MRFWALALALGLMAVCQNPALAQTVSVTVDLASNLGTVPVDFVGFSTELKDYSAGIYSPSNQSLISLLRLLGQNGVMRVGGSTADAVPPWPVSQQTADDAAAFLAALGPGWRLIYGLNGAVNDPNYAVTTAGYLINAFGPKVAFQVWNEPNLNAPGGEGGWLATFNAYHGAIEEQYGRVDGAGPDTSQLLDGLWPGDTDVGWSGFQYFTTHYYWPVSCAPLPTLPSAQTILDSAKLRTGIRWSLDEFGIICGGGDPTINGSLIAATYYLKLAQSALAGGWVHLMPHNVVVPETWDDGSTRPGYYNQFVLQPDGSYAPSPMFYGEYLFAKLLGRRMLSAAVQDYGHAAVVVATLNETGNAGVLVTNTNPAHAFRVRLGQSRSWSTAEVLVLSGSGCGDRKPLLGGAAIGAGGTWIGHWQQLVRGQTVTVPPCGAALVDIRQ